MKTARQSNPSLPPATRKARPLAGVLTAALACTALAGAPVAAADGTAHRGVEQAPPRAYVYTELQISVPFEQAPWRRINQAIRQQPGFLNKTWLAGIGNQSVGGFYAFDSIAAAQAFVADYFPSEAKALGVAQTTRVFDAVATANASRDMNSVHLGGTIAQEPGAYVYTEVQLHALPFDDVAPWRESNPKLKRQPGLLSKTWLSGRHSGTPGGFYAFDTVENARRFALEYFPGEAKALGAAFYARVFDAKRTAEASREMASPYYR